MHCIIFLIWKRYLRQERYACYVCTELECLLVDVVRKLTSARGWARVRAVSWRRCTEQPPAPTRSQLQTTTARQTSTTNYLVLSWSNKFLNSRFLKVYSFDTYVLQVVLKRVICWPELVHLGLDLVLGRLVNTHPLDTNHTRDTHEDGFRRISGSCGKECLAKFRSASESIASRNFSKFRTERGIRNFVL